MPYSYVALFFTIIQTVLCVWKEYEAATNCSEKYLMDFLRKDSLRCTSADKGTAIDQFNECKRKLHGQFRSSCPYTNVSVSISYLKFDLKPFGAENR